MTCSKSFPDIIISHVNKTFDGKTVLADFSARIISGQVNCISGPSGSGKTTLSRLICSLDTPDSGTISGMQGRKLSVVFQEDRLCENLTGATNIRFASGAPAPEVSAAMEATGLSDCLSQKVSTLSGGQRRRVAIARALLADFDLLVLDEPFKGLDDATKKTVIDWIKDRIAGKTVVLITHDEEEAMALGCVGEAVHIG